MKLRTGFVSNSSSSSFCILGFVADNETCRKVDFASREQRKRVHTERGISNYMDEKLIGIDASQIGNDETPRQVKQELIDVLQSLGVTVKFEDIDWCKDGGYNG